MPQRPHREATDEGPGHLSAHGACFVGVNPTRLATGSFGVGVSGRASGAERSWLPEPVFRDEFPIVGLPSLPWSPEQRVVCVVTG